MAGITDLAAYGAMLALGLGVGYVMKPVPQAAAAAVRKTVSSVTPDDSDAAEPVTAEYSSACRWTSGYHKNSAGVYPGAGITESLFPNPNKMLGTSSYQTASTNGSIIHID
jgi:hypothetical protein